MCPPPVDGIKLVYLILAFIFAALFPPSALSQVEYEDLPGTYLFIYDSTFIWPDGKGWYEYSRKFISEVQLAEKGRAALSRTATPILDKGDNIDFNAYTVLPGGEIFQVGIDDIITRNITADTRRIFVNFRHAEPGAILHFEWNLRSKNASIAGKRFFGRTIPVNSAVIIMTYPETWEFGFTVMPPLVCQESRELGDKYGEIYPVNHKWIAGAIDGLKREEYSPPYERMISGLYYSLYYDKSWSDRERRRIDWSYISELYKGQLDAFLESRNAVIPIADSIRRSGQGRDRLAIEAFDWVKNRFRSKYSDIGFHEKLDDIIMYGSGTQAEAAAFLFSLYERLGIPSGIYLASTRFAGEPVPEIPALFWFDRLLVACVLDSDTLWADPYYPVSDLGILPFEDQGVSVLRVDMNDGRLYSTPRIDYHDNGKAIHLKLAIDALGTLAGEATEVYTGAMIPDLSVSLLRLDESERKAAWERRLSRSLPDVNIGRFIAAPPDSFGEPYLINYTFTSGPIIRPYADRAYVPMDLLGRWEDLPDLPDADRVFPVYLLKSRFEFERITFDVAPQFKIEYLPKNYSLNSQIGEIYSVARQSGQSITVTRGLGLKSPVYPISAYRSAMKFFNTARAEAENQIILKRVE
jgi:hypothetical protein